MEQYYGVRVVIVGLGKSGLSAAEFLLAKGASVIGIDDNLERVERQGVLDPLMQQGFQAAKQWSAECYSHIDLIVCSPGVPPTHPVIRWGKEKNIEVIGEMELACRSIKCRTIGVTGTNGKTTVTLLLEHIFAATGQRVKAVGNVGRPITSELITNENDVLVIELSSYQLETLTAKVLDRAVILNITADHLDRYSSIESYIDAKFRILNCLKDNGVCYLHEDVPEIKDPRIRSYGRKQGNAVRGCKDAIYVDGKEVLKLPPALHALPDHDYDNIIAAYALCSDLGISNTQFIEGVSSFKKPPHRLEFVRKINGVSYYNDSKGTNVDAVVKAVASMRGDVILIAGGLDKGSSFISWLKKFAGKVKCICAIGEAASKINRELGREISVRLCGSLSEAVEAAKEMACSGENVLLSPGCSSFDMFRDFEHRGEEFKRIAWECARFNKENHDHEP